MEGKYRNWCFTAWDKPKVEHEKITYCIFQEEIAPDTKKLHFQGYLELNCQMRLSEIKKLLGDEKIHFEPRYGSQQQAIDYCQKKESQVSEPVIIGKPKSQGSRSDLDTIWEAIESGMTGREILKEFGGKALRVIHMITKGLEFEHKCSPIDKIILMQRELQIKKSENASEVVGNTEPTTEAIDDTILKTEVKYYMKEGLEKLMKAKVKCGC